MDVGTVDVGTVPEQRWSYRAHMPKHQCPLPREQLNPQNGLWLEKWIRTINSPAACQSSSKNLQHNRHVSRRRAARAQIKRGVKLRLRVPSGEPCHNTKVPPSDINSYVESAQKKGALEMQDIIASAFLIQVVGRHYLHKVWKSVSHSALMSREYRGLES